MTRAVVALLLLVSLRLGAQKNCDLGQPKFDNPFSDRGGFIMPRAAWHVFHAELAFGISETLHRVTHLPRKVTALVPPLASIVIHARGVATHRYALNSRDWMFDAALRSGPLLATIPNPMYGAVIYTAAYASLFCYAHP